MLGSGRQSLKLEWRVRLLPAEPEGHLQPEFTLRREVGRGHLLADRPSAWWSCGSHGHGVREGQGGPQVGGPWFSEALRWEAGAQDCCRQEKEERGLWVLLWCHRGSSAPSPLGSSGGRGTGGGRGVIPLQDAVWLAGREGSSTRGSAQTGPKGLHTMLGSRPG